MQGIRVWHLREVVNTTYNPVGLRPWCILAGTGLGVRLTTPMR